MERNSKGGTFIKTERALPVGTEFVFKLTLPKREAPFALQGAVIWTNQAAETQRPEVTKMGMGIRFIFAADQERQAFENQVEDLVIYSLGPRLFDRKKATLNGNDPKPRRRTCIQLHHKLGSANHRASRERQRLGLHDA